ncbi:MAG: shikimate dehydrogenase family protein [Sphingobacterium sp.]
MKRLGLIGYPLGHSFSKKYYLDKFEREAISGVDYELYPLENMLEFPALFQQDPDFAGVNVTIPYKQQVIPYLDVITEEATAIGAVNCIRIEHPAGSKPFLTGFNTDAFGFETSLSPLLTPDQDRALIFGNGGATKAISYVLSKLAIPFNIVSRTPKDQQLGYTELTPAIIANHRLLINCTPLGTYPKTDACPPIPYTAVGQQHLLYDLIYNPEETQFLKEGKARGARIKNGYEMLVLQAEKNWEIWNL